MRVIGAVGMISSLGTGKLLDVSSLVKLRFRGSTFFGEDLFGDVVGVDFFGGGDFTGESFFKEFFLGVELLFFSATCTDPFLGISSITSTFFSSSVCLGSIGSFSSIFSSSWPLASCFI
uniref:Uncharacterized protein n=1 Tax=Cacopsylla melanoneura TaxID=428564 RepID=A0A8D8XKD5_9HEMI